MKAIERVPIVQQVADNLKEYVLSGEVKVGEKMPTEMALCEMLGVGRGTVREALRILQASGYLEIQPGRGAFVAKTQETDIDDILTWFAANEVALNDCFEVRRAIEPLSVRLAIQRCTDEDIEELAAIHEKFVEAIRSGDPAVTAKYDERFHNKIVEASNNKLLKSIYDRINECISGFRDKTFRLEQNALNTLEPHTNIMQAISARDAQAAENHMQNHLGQIQADLEKSIRK